MTNAAPTTDRLNEGFYLGVAWAHANAANTLVHELRATLPLNHESQAALRTLSTELGRVVDFRTATGPADARSVTQQVIDTLSIAHVRFTEAYPARSNKTWRAISAEICAARQAVESQQV